jgi:hypothetical protein
MDVSDDDVDGCQEHDRDGGIPGPYSHLFDQLGSCCSHFADDEGIEVDDWDKHFPMEKTPPVCCPAPPSVVVHASNADLVTDRAGAAAGGESDAGSIDLYGSYLQDYQQTDYKNNLFDENLYLC